MRSRGFLHLNHRPFRETIGSFSSFNLTDCLSEFKQEFRQTILAWIVWWKNLFFLISSILSDKQISTSEPKPDAFLFLLSLELIWGCWLFFLSIYCLKVSTISPTNISTFRCLAANQPTNQLTNILIVGGNSSWLTFSVHSWSKTDFWDIL